jgi:hypothetical protein
MLLAEIRPIVFLGPHAYNSYREGYEKGGGRAQLESYKKTANGWYGLTSYRW